MRLFNKKQLEIIKFATNDPSRAGLHGLYFDGNKTVATDGHRLICVESDQKVKEDEWPANSIKWSEDDKPFTVPVSTVEKALKNIPNKADLPILKNAAIGLKIVPTGEPDRVACQTTDLDNTDNVEARTVDGKFPDYKRVIPDFENSELYQRVGINGRYLKEVCLLLEKYNDKSHNIVLYLKKDQKSEESNHTSLGEHCPMVVTADDGEGTKATAIIMPFKI